MARLVVARDMSNISASLKPEFVYVDRVPVGMLPQKTAVTAEVTPGWHRVWLGRGSSAGVWMEFTPDGRYLLRLRETIRNGSWRGDLIREHTEGYGQFAVSRKMKLAVMDQAGHDALVRHLGHPSNATRSQDSTARQHAIASARLPIVIKEAWYQPIPDDDAHPGDWQNNPGVLTLDESSLRFARGDSVVLEIPRGSITDVFFGSQKGGVENPWVKIGFKQNDADKGATFADASLSSSTENYNRLFAELAKSAGPH
jgi:hypothetical protein